MKSYLIIIISFFNISFLYAGMYEEENERLKKLDDKCIQVRTEKLKVIQKEKIEICVKNDKKERAFCERYFKNYGWGGSTVMGRNPRKFDQIPECIEAYNARKNRKR